MYNFFISPSARPCTSLRQLGLLYHLPEEVVDFVFPAAKVSAVVEVVVLLAPASVGRVQLDRPQEVARFLEGGAHGEDFVDEILHTDDAVRAWGGKERAKLGTD